MGVGCAVWRSARRGNCSRWRSIWRALWIRGRRCRREERPAARGRPVLLRNQPEAEDNHLAHPEVEAAIGQTRVETVSVQADAELVGAEPTPRGDNVAEDRQH